MSGEGARLFGARWNPVGVPVIYATASYALGMLEKLVHTAIGKIPGNQACVIINIPDSLPVEQVDIARLPGWDDASNVVSQAFGARWVLEQRSLAFIVPSVISAYESNVVINPLHPDYGQIIASEPLDVIWDNRLFWPETVQSDSGRLRGS
jgi:RES domain-containing protein